MGGSLRQKFDSWPALRLFSSLFAVRTACVCVIEGRSGAWRTVAVLEPQAERTRYNNSHQVSIRKTTSRAKMFACL